jgi:hypothetical protein
MPMNICHVRLLHNNTIVTQFLLLNEKHDIMGHGIEESAVSEERHLRQHLTTQLNSAGATALPAVPSLLTQQKE